MGTGILGVEPQGLGKMRRGFLQTSLADQNRSDTALGIGQGGFEPDRLDKLSLGFLEMPLLEQDHSQVFVCQGMVGIEPKGLVKLSLCLVEPPVLEEVAPQAEVCHGAATAPMAQDVGPEGLRCPPGLALGPGQEDQDQEHAEARRRQPHGGRPDAARDCPIRQRTGGHQHHPTDHGDVAVPIRGDLSADPDQAQVGCQDHQITQPDRQQPGPAPRRRNKATLTPSVPRMHHTKGGSNQTTRSGTG